MNKNNWRKMIKDLNPYFDEEGINDPSTVDILKKASEVYLSGYYQEKWISNCDKYEREGKKITPVIQALFKQTLEKYGYYPEDHPMKQDKIIRQLPKNQKLVYKMEKKYGDSITDTNKAEEVGLLPSNYCHVKKALIKKRVL